MRRIVYHSKIPGCCLLILSLLVSACGGDPVRPDIPAPADSTATQVAPAAPQLWTKPFHDDVKVKDFFRVMDSLVTVYDTILEWCMSEPILAHANPRIIDSLAGSDYYLKKADSIFLEDQKLQIVFRRGDSLRIPSREETDSIESLLASTLIDVNIPEFRLHILRGTDTVYRFPVRVGSNKKEYLETAGREVDTRTPVGLGRIVRIERDPLYINPETGKKYERTRRDDGLYTRMPQIPWIEPEINGLRFGTLIHPTTNPKTLGKAYSHGCIGMNEADAWVLYFNIRIGTAVHFRYDLEYLSPEGDTLLRKDIYNLGGSKKKWNP